MARCHKSEISTPRHAPNLPVSIYIVESALIRSARSSIAPAILTSSTFVLFDLSGDCPGFSLNYFLLWWGNLRWSHCQAVSESTTINYPALGAPIHFNTAQPNHGEARRGRAGSLTRRVESAILPNSVVVVT